MGLLPENEENAQDISFKEDIYPGYTYRIDWENGRIIGMCDELEAIQQAVRKALTTESEEYPVYSESYGTELSSLIGMPIGYVMAEAERIIRETLTWDSRITDVTDFSFDVQRSRVHVTFTVQSIYGQVNSETEVVY